MTQSPTPPSEAETSAVEERRDIKDLARGGAITFVGKMGRASRGASILSGPGPRKLFSLRAGRASQLVICFKSVCSLVCHNAFAAIQAPEHAEAWQKEALC